MSHETLWAEWKATDSVDFGAWLEDKYAALEAEVASLRINQQLKPKMPSLQEFVDIAGEAGIGSASSEWCYNYFARHFGTLPTSNNSARDAIATIIWDAVKEFDEKATVNVNDYAEQVLQYLVTAPVTRPS